MNLFVKVSRVCATANLSQARPNILPCLASHGGPDKRRQAEANSKRSESTPKTSTKYLHGTLSYILGKKDIKRSHRTNVMSREAGHLEQGEIQLSRGQKFSKAISKALRLLDGKDSTAILSVALLYTLLDFGLDLYFNLGIQNIKVSCI